MQGADDLPEAAGTLRLHRHGGLATDDQILSRHGGGEFVADLSGRRHVAGQFEDLGRFRALDGKKCFGDMGCVDKDHGMFSFHFLRMASATQTGTKFEMSPPPRAISLTSVELTNEQSGSVIMKNVSQSGLSLRFIRAI